MLERPLAGKDHCHLGIGLVACLDDLEIPHRPSWLDNGLNKISRA